jgi:hypothetical protein
MPQVRMSGGTVEAAGRWRDMPCCTDAARRCGTCCVVLEGRAILPSRIRAWTLSERPSSGMKP